MVNRITGTEMWVADNRVGEYMAAGHKLAVERVGKPEVKKSATKKKK